MRPLFYRQRVGSLAVATSVEALLDTRAERTRFDERKIVEFLLGTYSSRDATFFRSVRELPGGHVLTDDGSKVQVTPYWRPWMAPRPPRSTTVEAHAEYRHLFQEAVGERLRSPSPVLLHVSGGVDSSSIATVADVIHRSGNLPAPAVRGVASIHPGLTCDETPFIDAVARHISFPIDRWDGTVSAVSDPDLAAPALTRPGVRVLNRNGTLGDVEAARAHGAKVILTGTGGDELGSVIGFVRELLAQGRWSAAANALLVFPGANRRMRARRMKRLLVQLLPRHLLRWNEGRRLQLPPWLAPRVRSLATEILLASPADLPFESHLARSVWRRVTSARLGAVVVQFQDHGALHGVEYRFPFLDRELVSFVLQLDAEHWPRPRAYARLHRETLRPFLPPEVSGRFGKAEFTPALALRTQRAADQIRSLLEGGTWYSESFLEPSAARRFCRDVLAAGAAASAGDLITVWAMASLEAWLRAAFEYDTRALEDT
jgi:asparagine synthase (glutamine-hydrolysing)